MITVVTPRPDPAGTDVRYRLSPEVLFLQVDDGTARLLDLAGDFHALPETGAEMLLGLLQQGATATVSRMAACYEVGEDRIAADLQALVDQMLKLRLIHDQRTQPARKPGRGLAALVLLPWLRRVLRSRRSWQKKASRLMTLARLSFRAWGWAGTIARWKLCLPDPDGRQPTAEEEQLARTIDDAIRASAASHVLAMACKERGLCCWALLRSAGVPARLVVGLELYPLAGHCWCEVGGQALSDFPDRCESYTPVVRYE